MFPIKDDKSNIFPIKVIENNIIFNLSDVGKKCTNSHIRSK